MSMPSDLTWLDFVASVGDFLAVPLVRDGLILIIAVAFAPKVIRAITRVIMGS